MIVAQMHKLDNCKQYLPKSQRNGALKFLCNNICHQSLCTILTFTVTKYFHFTVF